MLNLTSSEESSCPNVPVAPAKPLERRKKIALHNCYILLYFKIILRHNNIKKLSFVKTTHSNSYFGRNQHLSSINLSLIGLYFNRKSPVKTQI